MPNRLDIIPGLLKAFEEFALFCKNKWRASFLALLTLSLLGAIFLLLFYGYKKIELLGIELDKGVGILEETHTTPEDLQISLALSVADNLLIDSELSKLMLMSKNATAAVFFKFHNSKLDLQGKHDFYYSGANEVSRDPKKSYLTLTQDVPITRLGAFMVPFLDKSCQSVFVDDIAGNRWMQNKLKSEDISALASCPVYDLSNRFLLGFIELVYTDGQLPERTPDNLAVCLDDAAWKISSIVSKDLRK